jgi:hypothetical protein
MKRTQLAAMIIVQVFVIVFLILAITQKAMVWYLASAASVTLLLILAVMYAMQQWNHTE